MWYSATRIHSFSQKLRLVTLSIIVFSFLFSPISLATPTSIQNQENKLLVINYSLAQNQMPNEFGTDGEANQGNSTSGKSSSTTGRTKNVTDYMQCNLLEGANGFTGCLAVGTYYLIYMPASFILGAIGNFFDIILLLSISRELINQEFIKTVWENVRDLANMAFIFILLWVAIATILRIKGNAAKDLLSKLIIVALLINFSLFITRVIVDAGNMFSMFFYNGFEVHETQNVKDGEKLISGNSVLQGTFIEQWIGEGDVKGVSGAFLHYTSINEMISLESDLVEAKGGTWWKLWTDQETPPATQHFNLIIYFLLSASLMIVLAWILFTTSFLFLTRVAILWLLMAVSPLAFVGMILPQSAAYVRKNFWGELVSKSFCITVFLFLLWFTLQFLEGANTWENFGNNKDFFETFIIVLLKFTVLTAILFYAKNITKKMCDSIGGVSLDIGKKLAGVAGLAVGGVGGMALRKFVGRAATNLAGNKGLRQRLGTSGAGRLALRGIDKGSTSTFDVRKTWAGGKTGLNTGVGAWGVKRGEGGYAGQAKRKEEELNKVADSFGDKDDPKAIAARKKLAEKLEWKSLSTEQKADLSLGKGGAVFDSIVGGMLKTFGGGSDQWVEMVDTEMKSRADSRKQKEEEYLKQIKDTRGAQSTSKKAAAGAAKTILKKVQAGEDIQLEKKRDKERFEKEKDALIAQKGAEGKEMLERLPEKEASPGSWKTGTEEALGDLNKTLRGINIALKQEAKREKDLMTTLGGLSPDERTGEQGRNIERQLAESRKNALENETKQIELEETKKDLERLSKRAEKESRGLREAFNKTGDGAKSKESDKK